MKTTTQRPLFSAFAFLIGIFSLAHALTIPASEYSYSTGDKLTLFAHRSNSLLENSNRKSPL